MKKTIKICILLLINCLYNVDAQTVNNNTELQAALTSASAGTTITLANGTWTNIYFSINKNATAANPIKIVAQTAGQVFFEGSSHVSLGGAYIIFEGVVFRNPSNIVDNGSTLEPVIEFRSSSNTSCTNCTVRNVKIDSYNGTTAQVNDVFKWIILYGQYNEVSYSSFVGKYGIGSIINDNRDVVQVNYNKIHHNYFANRTFVGTYVDENNDQDAIRIGNSTTSLSNSYTEVYNNLFENFFGEIEIISNKSCFNKYYNNTFRNYSGSLTLRHGNNCDVYNNYFFANNNQFSGGIRVIGENHKVYNNYIEGVNSTKSSAAGGGTSDNLGGINIMKGKSTSVGGSDLSGYYQVKNATILNNTFVNCDYGIRIGGGSQTLAPLDLVVANNIFLMNSSTKKAVDQIIAAISGFSYTFTGNIRQSGAWTLNGNLTSNQIVTSGLLTSGTDFYRVQSGSAAIDSGIGSYSYLTKDILNGNRPTTGFDAGAEEFGANGANFPYMASNVGTTIGFLSYPNALNNESFVLATNDIKLYPNPANNQVTVESNSIINTLEIFDLTGKKMYSKHINSLNTTIDVSLFSKGMYLVKVDNKVSKLILK